MQVLFDEQKGKIANLEFLLENLHYTYTYPIKIAQRFKSILLDCMSRPLKCVEEICVTMNTRMGANEVIPDFINQFEEEIYCTNQRLHTRETEIPR